MESSLVKLKINITVSAIQFSSGDLGKLKISMPQFNQMIVNKHLQYDDLNKVQDEVNALVSLTKLGYDVTQQRLAEAIVVSENVLVVHNTCRMLLMCSHHRKSSK